MIALVYQVTGKRVGTMRPDGETRAGERQVIAPQPFEYSVFIRRVAKREVLATRSFLHSALPR